MGISAIGSAANSTDWLSSLPTVHAQASIVGAAGSPPASPAGFAAALNAAAPPAGAAGDQANAGDIASAAGSAMSTSLIAPQHHHGHRHHGGRGAGASASTQPAPNLLSASDPPTTSTASGASALQTNTITDILQQLFGSSQ